MAEYDGYQSPLIDQHVVRYALANHNALKVQYRWPCSSTEGDLDTMPSLRRSEPLEVEVLVQLEAGTVPVPHPGLARNRLQLRRHHVA